MTDEDEGFNEMEKRSLWRKRAVQAAISTNPYRDQVIEEVALQVEKMQGFGKDTIDSLTVYIRNLKAWKKHQCKDQEKKWPRMGEAYPPN